MLDILRKHASSWIIKALLGAIVISFIFFFGWSTFRKGMRAPSQAVATVDGIPIPAAEFRFLLDQNYERLRSSFKENEVPDFVRKMATQGTLEQLISRTLMQEQADRLGIVIPDDMLIDAVKSTPAAQKDGEFDYVFYRDEYLPYFKQRFGIDFENFLGQELKLKELSDLFSGISLVPVFPEDGSMEWTFEVVTLDPAALKDSLKSLDEARAFAKMLISTEPARWREMLRKLKLSPASIGPIRIAQRNQLIEGKGTFEDHRAIFSLNKQSSVLPEPIERGGKVYVLRLVSVSPITAASEQKQPSQDYFRAWMEKLREKANVVSFLDKGK